MVKYIGRFFWFGVSISDCVVNCLIGCIFPYLSIISFDWTKVQPYKMFRADGSWDDWGLNSFCVYWDTDETDWNGFSRICFQTHLQLCIRRTKVQPYKMFRADGSWDDQGLNSFCVYWDTDETDWNGFLRICFQTHLQLCLRRNRLHFAEWSIAGSRLRSM